MPSDASGLVTSSAPAATDEQNAWVLEHLGIDMCLPGYPEPVLPQALGTSGAAGGEVCAQPPEPAQQTMLADQPAGPAAPQPPSPPMLSEHARRVVLAIMLAAGKLGGAIGAKLTELTSEANIAILVAFAGVYVAAQLTPAGWIADGLALGLLVTSAVMVGASLGAVIVDIRAFITITSDPNGSPGQAADHLARAVASAGVDTLVAILLHKGGSATTPYIKLPAGMVEVVTPDGMIVRMPAEAMAATAGAGMKAPPPMVVPSATLHMQDDVPNDGTLPNDGTPKDGSLPRKAPDPAEVQTAMAKGDIDAAAVKLGELGTNAKLDSLNRLTPDELAQLHDASRTKFGPDSPEARMSDPVHRDNLSRDPATDQIRTNERDTALRLEQRDNIELERFNPKPGEKGDFKAKDGKIYDGCSPGPAEYFDANMTKGKKVGKYEITLVKHLQNPGIDHVIVDTTDLGLSPQQLATLDALITRVAGPNAAKIVRLP